MNKLVKVYFTLFALLMSSTGVWAQENITYLNYVGGTAVFEEATHTATQITSSSTEVSISGWNYVEGDVTISNQVTLTGDTHLILCDGAKLTINSSYDGVLYDSGAYNLTIYAQSSGSHAGKLIINSDNAGIDYCVSGNVTINGGNISINSGGYGICCSQLTLNGGVVTVNSCLNGILARIDFTINGGKVSATGNEKGICGDLAANININGGQVYAEGNDAGIHSHQPINLGWKNASDYIEASKKMPSKEIVLQTQDSDYYIFKTDILAGMITYSTDKRLAANLETISSERALQIIEMNKRGEKPVSLTDDDQQKPASHTVDLLAGENIARFDKNKKKKKSKTNRQPQAKAPQSAAAKPKGQENGNKGNAPRRQRPPKSKEGKSNEQKQS